MKPFDRHVATLTAIGAKPVFKDSNGFTRMYELDALMDTVTFEIFANLVFVHIGSVQVVGDSILVNGYWPNAFKVNIVIKQLGNTVAIIPLEEYTE